METVLGKPFTTGNLPNEKSGIFYRLTRWLPEKYWPWVLLLLSIWLLFWQTPFMDEVTTFIQGFAAGMFEDSTVGWNKGYKAATAATGTSTTLLRPYSIGSIALGTFATAFLFGCIAFAVWLHNTILYKPLYLRAGLGYTVLYLFWLIIFWRMIIFVSNSFKTRMSAETIAYATVITGVCVAWAFVQHLRQSRQQQLILSQQKTQAELDALKAQVNPHFLFNSLNNIYGTAIVEDSPRTAESIQQLSGIVRYVMEESRLQKTDIQRELRFIDDYVELQRIRLPNQDNIQIETDIDWDEKPAQIVPLLLNPLIENAFKYGISIQHPCFVRIRLRVRDGVLYLTTENSVLSRTDLEKGTGLGLANVRQRLALAYPNRHNFIIEEKDETFLVDLTIKL